MPSGPPKVRSEDTDHRFRPGTDFFWLTGEMEPYSVLVISPDGDGHRATLYVEPPSDRSTHEFFTDARYGEFWIGPRMGLGDVRAPRRRHRTARRPARTAGRLAGANAVTAPRHRPAHRRAVGGATATTSWRQRCRRCASSRTTSRWPCCSRRSNSTIRGFEDVVQGAARRAWSQGERVVEGVFNARARLEGNDTGYDTIAASGAHATVLTGRATTGSQLRRPAPRRRRRGVPPAVHRRRHAHHPGVGPLHRRAARGLPDRARRAERGHRRGQAGRRFHGPHRAAMRVLAEGLHRLGILDRRS